MKIRKHKNSSNYIYIIITLVILISILFISFYNNITNKNFTDTPHNQVIKRLSDEENDRWALNSIGFTCTLNNIKVYYNPKIAVIDTGINTSKGIVLQNGYNTLDNSKNTKDTVGHGTKIAKIISTVSKNSLIIPVKITDSDSLMQKNANIIANAIIWSVNNGADIINLSFGMDEYNLGIDTAINYAIKKKVPIICAAGNYGNKELLFPARLDQAISVIARNINNIDSDFSNKSTNKSTKKSFSAPGVNVVIDNNKYSGTSYAAGYVTGIVAMIKSCKKNIEVKEIVNLLRDSSIDGNEFSYGLVRIDKIFDKIKN